jgi:formylmethanofuran dehydrogenase subunit E
MSVVNNRSLTDSFKVKDRSPGSHQPVQCRKCNSWWYVHFSMDIDEEWVCSACTEEKE